MKQLDLLVIVGFLLLLFLTGYLVSKQVHSSKDMFAAGNKAPWWIAGISSYMTMFSAGTFVVWGGIAYKFGLVAVTVCMMFGISALIAGFFIAGRWRKNGVSSAAEFIEVRYGRAALHAYTWLGLLTRMVGVAVALYSIAVLTAALIPLSPDSFFADAATGKLSITWAVIIAGIAMVGYTIMGGLWAVLMTDMLQFIILLTSVLLVVPMIYIHAGGFDAIVSKLPASFSDLTNHEFSWIFMGGWALLHTFKIGGEWAFVQRSICVPTPSDAKKANILFGVLYLVTPIFWMLPPLIFRAISDTAAPGQAYIEAAQLVLPAGMLGLMIASMFSATASMADAEINVFAGALNEVYSKFRPGATEKELLNSGRLFTVILGMVVILIAIATPYLGGVQKLVISTASLLAGPMIMPTVWGLFSSKIKRSAVWYTMFISFGFSALMEFGLKSHGFLSVSMPSLSAWVISNGQVANLVTGLFIPIIVMAVMEWQGRKATAPNKDWAAFKALEKNYREPDMKSMEAPRKSPGLTMNTLLAGFTGITALLIFAIGLANPKDTGIMTFFAVILALGSLLMLYYERWDFKRAMKSYASK